MEFPLLEERAYDETCTPEEREILLNYVRPYRDNIILWKEAPVMSIWQVEQFGGKLNELVASMDKFSLLIDLTNSKPPNSKLREALRNVFAPLSESGKFEKAAAFTEKNFLINVAAKFVLGGSGLKFSVHTKKEDAEKSLEN